jgi:hypothetical protein
MVEKQNQKLKKFISLNPITFFLLGILISYILELTERPRN